MVIIMQRQIIETEKNYVPVAKINEIKPGTMKTVQIKNRDILIANVEGKFYAMDDRCGHMNALLSMGKLQGKNVICPFHFAEFDVTTGKKIKDPVPESFKDMEKLPQEMQQFLVYAKKLVDPVKTYDIQTYRTKIEGDTIFIEY
jgi:nitrite reductase/ring-hydroxylating ferredoxin subunit